ncbi:MAG TPA: efflux RND transporter periplasmic adaptor subunit [Gemmataceae bacterium]|nr:efflux RND transporter periplasmic adaptor subunit [Gemmataceae bacterium]
MSRCVWLPLVLLACGLSGCGGAPSQEKKAKAPEVQINLPETAEVTPYEDFSGRTEAIKSVDVRARVTGYLDKVNFEDGAEVKKGAVLFEIDPRVYKAALDRAESNVALAEAHLRRLEADFARAEALVRSKAMSPEDYDKVRGDRDEAAATVLVNKANRDVEKLNYDFTKVTAPIDGRISLRKIDPGNLVKADDTLLTNIVTLDPIYATFDIDERTLLAFTRLLKEGKVKSYREAKVPVWMGLADEESKVIPGAPYKGFPHKGYIVFADNRVDPSTGTKRVRGLFDNPDRLFSPGLFVRIRLPIGGPHKSILIAERALGTTQGQKFLYLVKDITDPETKQTKHIVEERPVEIGTMERGLRVITSGLEPGEKVIVSGLQRVRPGAEVTPKLVPTQRDRTAAQPKSETRNPKSETNPKSEKANPKRTP